MATISSEFSGIPSSNASNSFDLYSNLTNGGEMHDQHQQRILRPQKMMQHMRFPQCPDPNIPTTSPTPTQQFHHENVSPTPNQVTPEKPSLSQSPPSPADSGVVADAKSDSIISQDLLHSFEQSENLDFMVNHKSPIPGMSFTASTISNEEKAQNSEAIFQPSDLNSLGLAPSAGFMSGLGNLEETESPAVPQSLAAIWAAPPPTSTVDDVLLQSFQQQQQLSSWPGQLSNGVSPNPPPGLYNTSLQNKLQQQNTAAQIQAIQQQLVMRRSQSTFMPQPGQLNRSTSHQPGAYLGMGGVGGKLNKPYSSWSNGQMLQGTWPQSGGQRPSMFNSLQHGSGVLNGASGVRKLSLSNQMSGAPRLARSISTPAKHGSQYNGMDDNPFFKLHDSQNNLMALTDQNDGINLSSLESQLYDIIRSNDNQGYMSHHNFPRSRGKWPDLNNDILFEDHYNPMSHNMSPLLSEYCPDRFSRKVFVGGLPPDIDEEEIQASFRQFGPLVVDWPHKAESKSYFPPKGYAFLLFQDEMSVQNLISCCIKDGDKLYLRVSSPTIREKPVQIRPWNLADSDFVLDGSQPLDPRKTIFVGGVPRPLRAVELAMIMDRLYGGVCYAGIDVDPELKYPKGAGRVAFSNQQSYIAAISARFVQLQHGEIDKRVEVKPYVLDDQHCDECQGARCGGKFAPFFCANVTCLQYYCEVCWATIHSRPGRDFHKPLVKEGADRNARSILRW